MSQKSKITIRKTIVLIIGSLTAMGCAFYNYYPIIFSDTGTYIYSGHELFFPLDRPIYYGLFLRLFDLGFSLWLVIFGQALFATWLITMFLEKNFNYTRRQIILAVFIASFCTSFSFTVSALIPDIFVPIIFLILYLYLINDTSIIQKIFLFLLIAMSIAFSFSNLLILLFFLFFFAIISILRRNFQLYFKKIVFLASFLIVLVFAINLTNKQLSGKESPSNGGVIFLVAKMIEIGVVNRMLDAECEEQTFVLCEFKDSLPIYSGSFLWDYSGSPLYKTGAWEDPDLEYSRLFWHSFTKWRYLELYLKDAIISPLKQLVSFEIGEGWGSYDLNSSPGGNISTQLRHEKAEFSSSLQNRHSLNLEGLNTRNAYLIVVSLLAFLTFYKSITPEKKMLIFLMLLFIYANAFICSVFSGVFNRYQARVTWLIPLIIVPIVLPILKERLVGFFKK